MVKLDETAKEIIRSNYKRMGGEVLRLLPAGISRGYVQKFAHDEGLRVDPKAANARRRRSMIARANANEGTELLKTGGATTRAGLYGETEDDDRNGETTGRGESRTPVAKAGAKKWQTDPLKIAQAAAVALANTCRELERLAFTITRAMEEIREAGKGG